MSYKFRVSVIVPIYNAQAYLRACLDSLVGQTIDKADMQVILIDDGSTDASAEICEEYCEKYSFFVYKKIKNSGVSAARNCGLKIAKGKYIMFLDSDDSLTAVSVRNVVDFFDSVYDQVDLVAYFIQPYRDDELLKPPARYSKVLTYQGVFDLEKNPYATQTTMNICVKNRLSDNVLFNEKKTCHEDQEYISRILMDKLRIGYCPSACYMYNKGNANSCVSTKLHSYYLFEPTVKFYESLFAQYPKKVPKYYQAMFFHDLRWKLEDRKLYPFHYPEEEFKAAVKRIKKLLSRVDTDIIINNPSIYKSHINYWLNLKPNVHPTVYIDNEAVDILADGKTIEHNRRVSMRIVRISQLDDGRFRIRCVYDMGVFDFMKGTPALYVIENGEKKQKLSLYRSSYSYVATDIMTNRVFGFEYSFDPNSVKSLSFKAVIDSYSFDVKLNFMSQAVFRHKGRFYSFAKGDFVISYYNDSLLFEKKTKDEIKKLELLNAKTFNTEAYSYELKCEAVERREESRIWLYTDCEDIKGNAYRQFLNDSRHSDGAKRFYVYKKPYSEIEHLFTDEQKKNLIKFGSHEHRLLYLASQVIFTSHYERESFSPFALESEEAKYIDIEHFSVVYLQHGVMNFSCIDRFSAERAVCDKIVVSSQFEADNLVKKYKFNEDELLKTGMPRLDGLNRDAESGKRVLFAPLWRSYFYSENNAGKVNIEQFKSSDCYRKTKAFLNDKKLHEALEKSGTVLDLRVQNGAKKLLADIVDEENSKRISIIEGEVKPEDYKLLITDFSDYAFDFAYLNRPVLYFVPDYLQFKSGMGLYRELELPFEKAFGPFVEEASKAAAEFSKIAENGYKTEPKYEKRMAKFYYPVKDCAEGIYNCVFERMTKEAQKTDLN